MAQLTKSVRGQLEQNLIWLENEIGLTRYEVGTVLTVVTYVRQAHRSWPFPRQIQISDGEISKGFILFVVVLIFNIRFFCGGKSASDS